jgi:pilus assembly protein Flp/PilA
MTSPVKIPSLKERPMFTQLIRDESGATAIEYGLIAALVAVAIIVALTALGSSLESLFQGISDDLDAATP